MQTVHWIVAEGIHDIVCLLNGYQLNALPLQLKEVGNSKSTANKYHRRHLVSEWQIQWVFKEVGRHLLLEGAPGMVHAHVVGQLGLPEFLLALSYIGLQGLFPELRGVLDRLFLLVTHFRCFITNEDVICFERHRVIDAIARGGGIFCFIVVRTLKRILRLKRAVSIKKCHVGPLHVHLIGYAFDYFDGDREE